MVFAVYLLYLDESGNPNGWQSQNHFVLGGVAIHEGQIYALSNELEAIQNRHFPGISVPIAFHATEIRSGKGQFRTFAPSIRDQILDDVYGVISNARFPSLIVYATALNISAVQNPAQVRRDTLEDVCTRFNIFLRHQFQRGHPTKGLLIIDRYREDQYRELFDDFKSAGIKYGYLGNIVDIFPISLDAIKHVCYNLQTFVHMLFFGIMSEEIEAT